MKRYVGTRTPAGATVAVIEQDGTRHPLPHAVKHSPTGFEWGYGGSGPSDLARSLLIDALGSAAICSACAGTGHVSYCECGREQAGRGPCTVCGSAMESGGCECWGTRYASVVERAYMDFKFAVVARWERDSFEITDDEVRACIEARGKGTEVGA